jgi:hypothetical protein
MGSVFPCQLEWLVGNQAGNQRGISLKQRAVTEGTPSHVRVLCRQEMRQAVAYVYARRRPVGERHRRQQHLFAVVSQFESTVA